MNSQRYVEVLERFVWPIINVLSEPQSNWLFMNDNSTCHTSNLSQAKGHELGLYRLNWSSKSPDLNPIEHVWSWMKRQVKKRLRAWDNMDRLEQLVREAWQNLPQVVIDGLIESVTDRVREVIIKKSGVTHY